MNRGSSPPSPDKIHQILSPSKRLRREGREVRENSATFKSDVFRSKKIELDKETSNVKNSTTKSSQGF